MTRIDVDGGNTTSSSRSDIGSSVAGVLWRRKFLVAAVALLCAIAGIAYSKNAPERYTSAARLYMSTSVPFDGIGERSFVNDPNRYVVNQAGVIMSEPVLAAAVKAGAAPNTFILRSNLEVVPGRDADVITIKADGASPTEAAVRANAVAKAYRSHASAGVQALTKDLVKLSTSTLDKAAVLKRAAVFGDGVAFVEVAKLPTEPSAPVPARDGLVALLAGIALGAVLALVLPSWPARLGLRRAIARTRAAQAKRRATRPVGAHSRPVRPVVAEPPAGYSDRPLTDEGQPLQPDPVRL